MKFTVNNLEWTMVFTDADKAFLNENGNTILGLTEYVNQTISIREGMTKEDLLESFNSRIPEIKE